MPNRAIFDVHDLDQQPHKVLHKVAAYSGKLHVVGQGATELAEGAGYRSKNRNGPRVGLVVGAPDVKGLAGKTRKPPCPATWRCQAEADAWQWRKVLTSTCAHSTTFLSSTSAESLRGGGSERLVSRRFHHTAYIPDSKCATSTSSLARASRAALQQAPGPKGPKGDTAFGANNVGLWGCGLGLVSLFRFTLGGGCIQRFCVFRCRFAALPTTTSSPLSALTWF